MPYFLDASGVTGTTFLLNLILAEIRKKGDIALAQASSGVVATLLHTRRIAYSALKLPLNFNRIEKLICTILDNPTTCKLFKKIKLIILDECTMANKKGPEALHITLQDLNNSKT